MVVALTGPGTPYITPDVLRRAPTGIDWTSIPSLRSSGPDQAAEQANICLRATGMIDLAANQVLRATLDTEMFNGPDWRVTIGNSTGVARVLCSRWPILQAVSCQVSPAWAFPRTWQTIPANMIDIDIPPIGVYGASQAADSSDGGQTILLAPGTMSWWTGRNGWRLQLQYISGWPHTSLTANAAQSASTISVEDITGWAPPPADASGPVGAFGATGIVYDGMQQEVIQCTAATPTVPGALSGPGTLTLAAPLSFPHSFGILATSMPQTIINAAIDFASAQALERGATSTTIQSMSGGSGDTGGPVSANTLREWATAACKPFARVI